MFFLSIIQRKRKKHNWLVILLLVFVTADLLLVLFLSGTLKLSGEAALPPETVAQTTGSTQPPAEKETQVPTTEQTQPPETEPTEETTEPSEEVPAEHQQPSVLTELLDVGGITYEELEEKNCSQLIAVVSAGTTAQIRFFSCMEGAWEEQPELESKGHVGRSGVGKEKREGDGCTPSGLFGIGSAFYIEDMPDTKLDIFQITDETYWVDDPDSVFYNQRVEGTQNKDWRSAEHMISYDVYRYGFVVEYNVQAVKHAGSAIFFHVGSNATAGCISTQESMVLAYLEELDKERNPQILIVCGDEA